MVACLCFAASTLAVLAQVSTNASPFAVANDAALFDLLDLTRPELAAVSKAVQVRDWPQAKKAWARHLATRTGPVWVWSRRDKTAIGSVYAERFGGLARYTNTANAVLHRDFELLGVRKQLGHKIHWLQGPVEWTHVLSRFGYWNDLGRAYWGTGNPIYAADFVFMLKDWVESNPVPGVVSNLRGVEGSVWRTLETGIRGQSWFDQLEFFMDAPEFDDEAKCIMTRSLVEHARYLMAHTTKYRPGNWQVCESAGLVTIGVMLPEFKAAADWRKTGLDMLREHMEKDVEPDGFHWELTPNYHRWVMLQFLHTARLCELNDIQLGDFRDRHEKMFEVFLKLRRPNGTYPPVGDGGRGESEISPIMSLGALLYQRPDFRYFADTNCLESWVWQFGANVCERAGGGATLQPGFTSVLMPDSKYAIMRSGWGARDKYLFFDCAPWRGSHSHQDRLQVTVFAGRDLIVDAGQISYDQPLSKNLRLTAQHSVLLLDGAEQLQADPALLNWHTDTQVDFASGSIQANGQKQQRSVLFVKPDYWVVVDHVSAPGTHEVTRLFHFAPGRVTASRNAATTTFSNGMNIRVQAVDDARLELRRGFVGASATRIAENEVAAFVSHGKLPMTLCTVLLPFERRNELPEIKKLKPVTPGESRIELRFPNGQKDEIVIAAEPVEMKAAGAPMIVQALCIRKGPVANAVIRVPGGIQKPTSP